MWTLTYLPEDRMALSLFFERRDNKLLLGEEFRSDPDLWGVNKRVLDETSLFQVGHLGSGGGERQL